MVGPGSGKSTGAAYIFAKLKMLGINCEYVTEYAKDKTWEGAKEALKCQLYITGKQVWRMTRIYNKVDVIITDSPIAMSTQYCDDELEQQLFIHESKKFPNQCNCFIKRVKPYQTSGRNQTEDEAKLIDLGITNMLTMNDIPFDTYDGCIEGYDEIISKIQQIIKKG